MQELFTKEGECERKMTQRKRYSNKVFVLWLLNWGNLDIFEKEKPDFKKGYKQAILDAYKIHTGVQKK